MRNQDDWEKLAAVEGFKNLTAFLRYYYIEMRLSTLKIAQKIALMDPTYPQVSRVRIRQLLNECGIPRRPAGEQPRGVGTKQATLDRYDPAVLNELSTREISIRFGVHQTTARRFKRRMQYGNLAKANVGGHPGAGQQSPVPSDGQPQT